MKVSTAIAEILVREGVDTIFGYPRNAVLEQAAARGIRTIIVRQERTGLHMADAYSRMTRGKRMGVFAMQHGPGTENAYCGVAQAYSESVPVLVLPQGYARRLAHVRDNYNASLSMRDITKLAEPILRAEDTPAIMARAFTALRNGRLRPALVEMPWDVLGEEIGSELDYQPVVSTRCGPDPEMVEKVAERLVAARRLVIHAGQGVHWAEAYGELRELSSLLAAPVSTSLEGKSAFDETHPLALGSGGEAIPGQLRHFLDSADLILGVGCSFAETAFGVSMPRNVEIIHATLDPADLNKGVRCTIALIGDARLTLRALIEACRQRLQGARDPAETIAEIREVEQRWLAQWLPLLECDDAPLNPYRVLWDLQKAVGQRDIVITHDAGSPRDQLTPFWKSRAPLSYIGWGKSTQLGYGLGLAMGAKLAEALGGYGERVTRPEDIMGAIARGIAATEAGRPALLEFITSTETRASRL